MRVTGDYLETFYGYERYNKKTVTNVILIAWLLVVELQITRV